MTREEKIFMAARMVQAEADDLVGFILIAVTAEPDCNHTHVRAMRAGRLTKAEELTALDIAVKSLYELCLCTTVQIVS